MEDTKLKFPEVIAAVKAAEASPWVIGDALKKIPAGKNEVNDGSHNLLREVADEIARECNCEKPYTVRHLHTLRHVANAFGVEDRLQPYGWRVHKEAGSPKALKEVIEGAPEGTKITGRYAKSVLKPQKKTSQKKRDRRPEGLALIPLLCTEVIGNYRTKISELEFNTEIHFLEAGIERLTKLKITLTNIRKRTIGQEQERRSRPNGHQPEAPL